MNKFEEVRQWGKIRGLNTSTFQRQYQKVLQETVEIHEADCNDDIKEIIDAIGDTMVTLINLGTTKNLKAEDCLADAFDVIKLRKGLNFNGDFVRYAKLSDDDKIICDQKQGNIGSEYFLETNLNNLNPESFKR